MTKVYIVNDNDHETCLGAFSSEEKAMQMIDATAFLGDELTWIDYEVDEPLSRLNMLKEMQDNGERIYSLSSYGDGVGNNIRWQRWYVSTLSATRICEADHKDFSNEYTFNGHGSRFAIIKAHSEVEAIKIAEEILVKLT